MALIKSNKLLGFTLACCFLAMTMLIPLSTLRADGANAAGAPAVMEEKVEPHWLMEGLFTFNFRTGQTFNITQLASSPMSQVGLGFDLQVVKRSPMSKGLMFNVGFITSYQQGFGSSASTYTVSSNNILQMNLQESHQLLFGGLLGVHLPKAKGLSIDVEAQLGPNWVEVGAQQQNTSAAPQLTSAMGVAGQFGLGIKISPVKLGDAHLMFKIGAYYSFGDIVPFTPGFFTGNGATINGVPNNVGLLGQSFLLKVGAGLSL